MPAGRHDIILTADLDRMTVQRNLVQVEGRDVYITLNLKRGAVDEDAEGLTATIRISNADGTLWRDFTSPAGGAGDTSLTIHVEGDDIDENGFRNYVIDVDDGTDDTAPFAGGYVIIPGIPGSASPVPNNLLDWGLFTGFVDGATEGPILFDGGDFTVTVNGSGQLVVELAGGGGGGGGGGTWGSITGTLADQTDLQTALNNKEQIPRVISSNATAENNDVLIVVATCTITDPSSPVEGRGFRIILINGVVTYGISVGESVVGTVIDRIYHSGSWVNIVNGNSRLLSSNNTFTGATNTFSNALAVATSSTDGHAVNNTRLASALSAYVLATAYAAATGIAAASWRTALGLGAWAYAANAQAALDALGKPVEVVLPASAMLGPTSDGTAADCGYVSARLDTSGKRAAGVGVATANASQQRRFYEVSVPVPLALRRSGVTLAFTWWATSTTSTNCKADFAAVDQANNSLASSSDNAVAAANTIETDTLSLDLTGVTALTIQAKLYCITGHQTFAEGVRLYVA